MEAKDHLGSLIELAGVKARWPLLVETDLLLGRALLGLGAVEKAQSCFLDAYERSRRKNAVAYAAMVLFELSYQTSTGTEISKSALFWAERLDRADVRAGRRANYLFALRDYEKAVAAGEEAIRANPRDARTRVLLADALERLGQTDAAAVHIAALERLDSANSNTYGILSWYHGMRGENAAATDAAMRAYELNPENLDFLTLAARWSIYAGDHAKARDLLDRVLAKTPDSTSALDHLGQLLTEQRDFDAAIAAFERGFAIDPNDCAIANSYAWTFRRMGRLEDAERMCRRSVAAGWKNVLAHHNLVGILLERGKPHEAAIAAEAALADVEPLDAKLHAALGRAREGLKDFDRAAAAYARAVDTAIANDGEAELDSITQLVERGAITPTAIATVVETIRRAVEGRKICFPLLQLVGVLRARSELPDAQDLLAHARADVAAGIQRAAPPNGRSLALLAAIDFELGEHASAIRTLEEAQRLPDASGSIATQVEDYRRVALPDLSSYGSIDAALRRIDRAAVIADGAEWRFLRGTRAPLGEPIAWTRADFDDSDWEHGPSGFGYGDLDDRTRLDDMRGNYTTLAIRRTFTLDDSARYSALVLSVRADDGFVAYLDGQEIGRERAGKPGDPPLPFDAVATTFAPEWPLATTEIPIDGAALGYGTHVLAIQVLNVSTTSSDLSMIPVLEAELDPDPARDRALLAAFRAVASGPNAAARVAYLEGRLAERSGDRERAAERFSESARLDPGAPEPRAAAASARATEGPTGAAGG